MIIDMIVVFEIGRQFVDSTMKLTVLALVDLI